MQSIVSIENIHYADLYFQEETMRYMIDVQGHPHMELDR